MKNRLGQVIRGLKNRLARTRHWLRLKKMYPTAPESHREYLRAQMERSVKKRHMPLRHHTIYLINQLCDFAEIGACDVLCVGCRNPNEILQFQECDAKSVQGIDLHSTHPNIRVMDMHRMDFDDSLFDIVYSAHSLEHALDPSAAVGEFLRVVRPGGLVAVEVPLGCGSVGTDLQDYGSTQALIDLFGDRVGEVLLEETREANTDLNKMGTMIGRIVFRVAESAS